MFNNDIGKGLLFFKTIGFGAKMKWLVLIFLLAVFIAVILNSPYKALFVSYQGNSAFAATTLAQDVPDSKNNPNSALIEEIDKGYQQKIKYAIIITFAVLFIAGVYWWTYGKLHHKLPRY